MSHVADVSIQINDLEALKAACERLGFELRVGQKTHAWYGRFLNDWRSDRAAVNRMSSAQFGHCEHAIRAKDFHQGDYEIGVIKDPSGAGYNLIYDVYGPGHKLEKLAGVGLTKIKQEYAAEVATRQLARQGYRLTRSVDQQTGQIKLVARR